jgi:hypothetical protein
MGLGGMGHQGPLGIRYIRRVIRLSHFGLVLFMGLNLVFGHDWVHVPALLEHYAEHRAEHPDLGPLEFLALHYADADHRASDQSHEELPFQSHHHGAGIDLGTAKVIGHEPLRAVSFPERSGQQDFPLPDAEALLSGHAADLLRPPRPLA